VHPENVPDPDAAVRAPVPEVPGPTPGKIEVGIMTTRATEAAALGPDPDERSATGPGLRRRVSPLTPEDIANSVKGRGITTTGPGPRRSSQQVGGVTDPEKAKKKALARKTAEKTKSGGADEDDE
jgi:hypothetical protein